MSGDMGSPNGGLGHIANQHMQTVINADDIEWWDEIENNPPYDVWRDYLRDDKNMDSLATLKEYIQLVMEQEEDEEDEMNEFSGSGGVAGYTLPLGMQPRMPGQKRKKKKKPAWKAAADAFGGAKKA